MMQSDYKYKTDLSLVLGQCELDKPTDTKNLLRQLRCVGTESRLIQHLFVFLLSYIQELLEYYDDGGVQAEEALKKIKDPSLKAFLKFEFDGLKLKK